MATRAATAMTQLTISQVQPDNQNFEVWFCRSNGLEVDNGRVEGSFGSSRLRYPKSYSSLRAFMMTAGRLGEL